MPVGLAATGISYAYAGTAAVAVAGAVAVAFGPTWWRGVRRRWTFVRPTLAAVRESLGEADVRLKVRGPLTRPAKPPSHAEAAVRAWYGARLEPAVRWLPDRGMRAWWSVARPLDDKLALFRRPDPPRVRMTARAPYLTDEQRRFVSAVIHAKLPVGETVERWSQIGRHVTGTWTPRHRPPTKCGLAELESAISTLVDGEIFFGLGPTRQHVVVSLHEDSPHIAVSAGSGAGKSVLAQLAAVQVLSRGGYVVILDRKGSHRWARNLPGVTYCRTADQMHDELIRLARLADQRNNQAFDEHEDWDPGPRVLVICEELNATLSQLTDYWADIREKGDPKVSPAIKSLRELLFMGRSAKIHVLAIAQMLTARAIGGPEARENFGIRCLARYSANAWKMLVPEAALRRASRTLGRWQVVVAGVATETQVCYLTPAQARKLARAGHVTPKRDDGLEQPIDAGVTDDPASPVTLVDPLSEPVTLEEWVAEGLFDWTLAAAKMRMSRVRKAQGQVPKPIGRRGRAHLYRRGDLVAFAAEQEKVGEDR